LRAQAKQSSALCKPPVDCFVASLLAMTMPIDPLHG
jgi:hypothetical protein